MREYAIRRPHADVTGRRKPPTITEATRSPSDEPGPVESAVATELAEYAAAAERPALAAVAKVLARDLDTPGLVGCYSRLARELKAILDVSASRPRLRT